ncbi:MFS transporter [Stenotrophomonas sp. ATCM1_4]|uniref:MFS transporter n=1 Tax=Stenotrophomonas capsici TaxID=3110230 RepID=A0ABU5V7X1_9GAMM|nr:MULTISPECIES: MFS transporter [unclassified Stenotrophomonas]MEA5669457.1 MFS transporter [Stenotrophomonas sp. MH1]TDB26561.1 MFS transporter [Stenotrophomonas sp. ATCM1_4]
MTEALVEAPHRGLPRLRRLFVILLLGFASGLPLALTGGAMQAWLTVEGLDLVTLGFLSLIGIPYTFKFLWAPLIDRFDLPLLGRRRGWIVLMLFALAAALLVMSSLSPSRNLGLFASVAVVVACLSATLDVVIDAYRTDLLQPAERGLGGSLTVLGYRLAMVLSGGITLIWAEQWQSWPQVYRVMASLAAVVGVLALVLMPPLPARFKAPVSKASSEVWGFLALVLGVAAGAWLAHQLLVLVGLDPDSSDRWVRLVFVITQIAAAMVLGLGVTRWVRFETLNASLRSYFGMRGAGAFLALVVLYKVGDAFALSLSTPFLLKGMHFSQAEVGLANKTIGLLMTIVGAIVGGFFLLRLRLSTAVIAFGVLQLVSNLGFYLLAREGAGAWGTVEVPAFNLLIVHLDTPTPMDGLLLFALSLDNFAGGMGTAAFVALLSGLCGTRFSATHYALLSAFATLGRVFVGPFAGVLADAYGWQVFFLVSVVVGMPGLLMAWWLRREVDATTRVVEAG